MDLNEIWGWLFGPKDVIKANVLALGGSGARGLAHVSVLTSFRVQVQVQLSAHSMPCMERRSSSKRKYLIIRRANGLMSLASR